MLFELLRERVRAADSSASQSQGKRGGGAQNSFTLSMQFCEIYNDEVRHISFVSSPKYEYDHSFTVAIANPLTPTCLMSTYTNMPT